MPPQEERGGSLGMDDQVVSLIVARRTIKLEDEVRLDLRRVFGIADIKVTGASF